MTKFSKNCMKECGLKISFLSLVLIIIAMEIGNIIIIDLVLKNDLKDIKENTIMEEKMDLAFISMPMETFMQEALKIT